MNTEAVVRKGKDSNRYIFNIFLHDCVICTIDNEYLANELCERVNAHINYIPTKDFLDDTLKRLESDMHREIEKVLNLNDKNYLDIRPEMADEDKYDIFIYNKTTNKDVEMLFLGNQSEITMELVGLGKMILDNVYNKQLDFTTKSIGNLEDPLGSGCRIYSIFMKFYKNGSYYNTFTCEYYSKEMRVLTNKFLNNLIKSFEWKVKDEGYENITENQ